MGQRDLIATARIRQELRERLMAERVEGVWELLLRFGRLAERHPELASEVDRWRLRFELLSVGEPALGVLVSPVA